MTSKTISLKEETYRRLARSKGEGESFSDVIDRLLRQEGDEEHPLYGLIGLLDEEDADALRDRAREFRADVDDRLQPGQ
jgi:predicted CopG family antitoxin